MPPPMPQEGLLDYGRIPFVPSASSPPRSRLMDTQVGRAVFHSDEDGVGRPPSRETMFAQAVGLAPKHLSPERLSKGKGAPSDASDRLSPERGGNCCVPRAVAGLTRGKGGWQCLGRPLIRTPLPPHRTRLPSRRSCFRPSRTSDPVVFTPLASPSPPSSPPPFPYSATATAVVTDSPIINAAATTLLITAPPLLPPSPPSPPSSPSLSRLAGKLFLGADGMGRAKATSVVAETVFGQTAADGFIHPPSLQVMMAPRPPLGPHHPQRLGCPWCPSSWFTPPHTHTPRIAAFPSPRPHPPSPLQANFTVDHTGDFSKGARFCVPGPEHGVR